MKKLKSFSGFSLMEMMVVLLIVAVVMAAAAPMVSKKMANSIANGGGNDLWQLINGLGNRSIGYNIQNPNPRTTVVIGQRGEGLPNNANLPRFVVSSTDPAIPQIRLRDGIANDSRDLDINFSNESVLVTDDTTQAQRAVVIGSRAQGGTDTDSTAVGWQANATGDVSTAIGYDAQATADNTTALGHASRATAASTTAVGRDAQATGADSTALGHESRASMEDSTAVGEEAQALGQDSTAVGWFARSREMGATTLGSGAIADANATSIGWNSRAHGDNSIAIGRDAITISDSGSDDDGNIAIGHRAYSLRNSIAIGRSANANWFGSIAIGDSATVDTSVGIAIGLESHSSAADALAIGNYSIASGNYSTAIASGSTSGTVAPQARATGDKSIAIGPGTLASGTNSVAIGSQWANGSETKATKNNTIAIGLAAKADGDTSIAIGSGATASEQRGIAIGQQATATQKNSVAIGFNAKADHDNQITLGDENTVVYIPGELQVCKSTYLSTHSGRVWATMDTDEDYYSGTNKHRWGRLRRWGDGNEQEVRHIKSNSYNSYPQVYMNSDRQLKNVRETFKGGLAELKKLEFFHYTFKEDESKTPRVGVMAQDLQKVFPDAVIKGEDGFLRIRLEDMFYAVINAVKELDTRLTALAEQVKANVDLTAKLQAQVNEQSEQIAELKKQNAEFEKRLAKLERKTRKCTVEE